MGRRWRQLTLRGSVRPELSMTLPRSAADVLSEHVVFELECIDRVYLLSGLPGGSSQFSARARDEVDIFRAVTEYRDLAALVVPPVGSLEPTGDPWEPWRLCDPSGAAVAPVAAYLRDLQAAGRPETTQRTYAIALLRWFRFLWAAGVAWDQATRAEARDFCRWIQVSTKPRPGPGGEGGAQARVRNPVTGKAAPGRWYAPATAAHSESVQLPASPDAFVWLRLYQAQIHGLVPAGPDDPLWWTLRRPFRALGYQAAYRMFRRASASLGANWSLHDLRHLAAYRMTHDPAMPLADVQWILGHARLTTTQIYLDVPAGKVIESALAHLARVSARQAGQVPAADPALPADPAPPEYRPQTLDVRFGKGAW
jgi:hypothetical protein